MNNLRKIKDKVVREGFPELLDNVKINIRYSRYLKHAFGDCERISQFDYLIRIRNFFKTVPQFYLEGLIAHEVSHAYFDSRRSDLQFNIITSLTNIGVIEDLEEVSADIEAIKRGFGIKILEFQKWFHAEGLSEKNIRRVIDYYSASPFTNGCLISTSS